MNTVRKYGTAQDEYWHFSFWGDYDDYVAVLELLDREAVKGTGVGSLDGNGNHFWYEWDLDESFEETFETDGPGFTGNHGVLPFTLRYGVSGHDLSVVEDVTGSRFAGELADAGIGIAGPVAVAKGIKSVTKLGEVAQEGAEAIGKSAGKFDETVKFATGDLGNLRAQRVAEITGGKVSGEKIKVLPHGTTDIDVIGPRGELIAVGGAAKANSIADLGNEIVKLIKEGKRRGVRVMYYFAKDTPEEVLDFARKRLGKENVFIFDL